MKYQSFIKIHTFNYSFKMSLDNLNIDLKENVLPFAIDGEKFYMKELF